MCVYVCEGVMQTERQPLEEEKKILLEERGRGAQVIGKLGVAERKETNQSSFRQNTGERVGGQQEQSIMKMPY